jgi:hypothetical protein
VLAPLLRGVPPPVPAPVTSRVVVLCAVVTASRTVGLVVLGVLTWLAR